MTDTANMPRDEKFSHGPEKWGALMPGQDVLVIGLGYVGLRWPSRRRGRGSGLLAWT